MQNKRDQNHVTVGSAISEVDLTTPLMLSMDSATNELLISVTIEALSTTSLAMVRRDQNFRPTYYGISSVDGVTVVPIRTDSAGRLLIKFV